MKRKAISVFLALCMMISVIPLGVITATAETSGDFEYSVISEEEKTCQITKYNGMATELTIPSQLDRYTVTKIGDSAFKYCDSLTSVIIPDRVKSIGEEAFNFCTSLASMIIPNSVTSIDDFAFSFCGSLTDITIPDSVTSIGKGAFQYCISLTSITIPDSVTSIGDAAFGICTSMENIYVSLGNKNYCDIDGVLFNKAVTELNGYPAGKSEDYYIIPNGVTSIGNGAFVFCRSLTNIIIPDSVTSIGIQAFAVCTSLESIAIPDSVSNIGGNVFEECESLTAIYGYSGSRAATYASENSIPFIYFGDIDGDGIINSNDYAMLKSYFMCQSSLTEEQRMVADFDGDGAVDAFDVIALDVYLHKNKI